MKKSTIKKIISFFACILLVLFLSEQAWHYYQEYEYSPKRLLKWAHEQVMPTSKEASFILYNKYGLRIPEDVNECINIDEKFREIVLNDIGDVTFRHTKEEELTEITKFLIATGFNLNLPIHTSNNLMERLIMLHGDLSAKAVALLITAGANINESENSEGKTALHKACEQVNCAKVVSLLIKAGANIDAKSYSGETPLSIAIENYNIEAIHILIKEGARVDYNDQHIKRAISVSPKQIERFIRAEQGKHQHKYL